MDNVSIVRTLYALDLRAERRARRVLMLVAVAAPTVVYLVAGEAVHALAAAIVSVMGVMP